MRNDAKHETTQMHFVCGCGCVGAPTATTAVVVTAAVVRAKLDAVIIGHTCSMRWLATLAGSSGCLHWPPGHPKHRPANPEPRTAAGGREYPQPEYATSSVAGAVSSSPHWEAVSVGKKEIGAVQTLVKHVDIQN